MSNVPTTTQTGNFDLVTAQGPNLAVELLPGGGGITQLTGDVTAGPGAGAQAAHVVGIGAIPVGVLFGNWVQYTGIFGSPLTRQPSPGLQTAPNATCVAAAVLQCQNSGIFYVSFGATWVDHTVADVVTVKLVGNQVGGPGVLTSSTGGFVARGQAGDNVAYATSGPVEADQAGAAGLLLDGTAINTFSTPIYPGNPDGALVPTGGAASGADRGTQTVSWSGILSAGAINKARFSVGQKVCFGLLCTSAGGHVVEIGNANILVWEVPFG